MKTKAVSVFILAGGESRRMGKDKGLVLYKGQAMISHVISIAKQISAEITILTQSADYQRFLLPLLADIVPSKGPMGGIYTALKSSQTELNLFLPCDSPNLKIADLQQLIALHSRTPCLAESNGKLHPVIGLYSKKQADSLGESIKNNQLSLTQWALANNAEWFHYPNETPFHNINTPMDLL